MRKELIGLLLISSIIFIGCENNNIPAEDIIIEGVGSIDNAGYLEEKEFVLGQVKSSMTILDEAEAIDRAVIEPLNDIRLYMKNLRETVTNSEVLEIDYKDLEIKKIDNIDILCLNLETYLLNVEGEEKDGLIYFDLTNKEVSELIKQIKENIESLKENK